MSVGIFTEIVGFGDNKIFCTALALHPTKLVTNKEGELEIE